MNVDDQSFVDRLRERIFMEYPAHSCENYFNIILSFMKIVQDTQARKGKIVSMEWTYTMLTVCFAQFEEVRVLFTISFF